MATRCCPTKLDLFVLGGGGILFDGEVQDFLREVALAHEMGVPVMVYAVGAGPLRDPRNQRLVREALEKAAIVTVRERSARKVLEDAGVVAGDRDNGRPSPAPDPRTAALRKHSSAKASRRGGNWLAMSVREPGLAAPDINQDSYHALLANAADYIVDRYNVQVVFVPMERKVLDMQHAHAVISQMLRPQKAGVLSAQLHGRPNADNHEGFQVRGRYAPPFSYLCCTPGGALRGPSLRIQGLRVPSGPEHRHAAP